MTEEHLFHEDLLVREGSYGKTMRTVVLPALDSCRNDERIQGYGGRQLACSVYTGTGANGTVMIVHGFTECAVKYAEIIYSLIQNGFNVIAYDQRGHGRSWRDEEIEDLSLTHVDAFEDYVRDLECVSRQLLTKMPKPWLLFSHSMGGAVSGLFLEEHPDVYERAVMSAPMIAPFRYGIPLPIARLMCAVPKAFHKGKKRIFASKAYSGPEEFETSAATSRERFEYYDALKASVLQYQNNGPSYSWLLEALNVTGKLLAPGRAERICIPVRIYQAELDSSVLPDPQKAFADRLKSGRLIPVKNAKHEIYRSKDEVLVPWWDDVLRFFRAGSPC